MWMLDAKPGQRRKAERRDPDQQIKCASHWNRTYEK